MKASDTPLLKSRFFLPLFITQFLGAFNDNAFKLALLTTISYHLSRSMQSSEQYQALAGALFILPFFLFSATAGELADCIDKSRVTRWIKIVEVLLMLIGAAGLLFHNIPCLLATLTGMGMHSTFFGPIKFSILPDHLPQKNLLEATGLIEGSTWIAILAGTTLGTLSVGSSVSAHPEIAIMLTLTAAATGLFASFFIPPAPPASENQKLHLDWNLLRSTKRLLQNAWQKDGNSAVFIAISWFWLLGAVMLTKLPDYVHYVLGAETTVFATFLAIFSIGTGIGSLTINLFLKGRAHLHHVPWILLVISVFTCDLYFTEPATLPEGALHQVHTFFRHPAHWRIVLDFLIIAIMCGFCIVPLYTWLQIHNGESVRSRIIAANNVINSFFIVISSLVVMALAVAGVHIVTIFMILGLLSFMVAIMLYKRLPADRIPTT